MKKETQLRGIQVLGQFYLKENFSYGTFSFISDTRSGLVHIAFILS